MSVRTLNQSNLLISAGTIRPEFQEPFYEIQLAPDGIRVLGVVTSSADARRPDASVTPVTRLPGAEVDQPRRRGDTGWSFPITGAMQDDTGQNDPVQFFLLSPFLARVSIE